MQTTMLDPEMSAFPCLMEWLANTKARQPHKDAVFQVCAEARRGCQPERREDVHQGSGTLTLLACKSQLGASSEQ